MTETVGEREMVTWSVPQCPFTIEISARVLDDIRLAVVDAFFSLPRGGAEIGGILLGKCAGDRLTITDYAALDCEHAHGPSFTLSQPDVKRLTDLLSIHGSFGGGSRPVGWYHSHTRSEIFLSEADLALYARFFPEPWQVALVMKPHTFQPARVGFFFREGDGSIHATESYQEVPLEGLRVQPMPGPVPTAATYEELPVRRREPAQAMGAGPGLISVPVSAPVVVPAAMPVPAPVVGPAATPVAMPVPVPLAVPVPEPPAVPVPEPPAVPVLMPVSQPALAPIPMAVTPATSTPAAIPAVSPAPANAESAPPPFPAQPARLVDRTVELDGAALAEIPSPRFGMEPERPARSWSWVVIAAVVVGIAGAAVQTREMWLPRLMALVEPAPKGPALPPALGLNSIDREGQLQISWNPNSPAIRSASDAILEITEGGATSQAIQLDGVHLQAGSFTFAREADNVDIKLTVHRANGPDIREAIGFLGRPPVRKSANEDPQVVKRREEDDRNSAKLKADLNFQAAKTRRLEKDLVEMKQELDQQQLRRLKNQVPDKK